MVRNAVNRGVVRDILFHLVGIHFSICGNSIDPGHTGDVFDVGYVSFERSPEAAISREAAGEASVAIVQT